MVMNRSGLWNLEVSIHDLVNVYAYFAWIP